MPSEERIAVYPGSFDPFHLGHENIVRRAAKLFDRVIVAVGYNPQKTPGLSREDRIRAIQLVVSDLPNVEVVTFSGLAVQFVHQTGARFMVRGIRALSDTEYEFSMSLMNASMAPQIETVFLMAAKEFTHLSSTLIRQIAHYGGDLNPFLPPAIIDDIRQKLAAKPSA